MIIYTERDYNDWTTYTFKNIIIVKNKNKKGKNRN